MQSSHTNINAYLPRIVDTHNHIQDSLSNETQLRVKTGKLFLMACYEDDWARVSKIVNQNASQCVAWFGIHPWWSATTTGGWEERLKQLLQTNPNAHLGEIGLDKFERHFEPGVREYNFETQMQVFDTQMRLAGDLGRNVSIHLVRAHGDFLKYLKSAASANDYTLPPKIHLHSFSGSKEMVKSLMKLPKRVSERLYFSISNMINGLSSDSTSMDDEVRDKKNQKQLELIRLIPDDRLLVESDEHDWNKVDESMVKIMEVVCQAKNWEFDKCVDVLEQNQKAFSAP